MPLFTKLPSENLGDEKEEVDKLVEEYRHSLIRYRYQERLDQREIVG